MTIIIVETGWPNEGIIIIIIVTSCLFIYIGYNTGMGDPLGMHLSYVHFVGVRPNGMWPISAITDYCCMALISAGS